MGWGFEREFGQQTALLGARTKVPDTNTKSRQRAGYSVEDVSGETKTHYHMASAS